MSVFAFIIFLFHYNSIQTEVRAGRCYKLQDDNALLGTYTIRAKNSRNEDLYKIDYNLDSKSFNLKCACKPGNVVNDFNDINVYDISQTPPSNRVLNTICNCAKPMLGPDKTVYYSGYPGIVRYMRSQDTSFFDKALR